MRRAIVGGVGAIVLLAGAAPLVLAAALPARRPAPDVVFEPTPERLERGRYLVEHVALCTDCHSEPRGDRFGIPHRPDTHGAGGLCWTRAMGFPGELCTKNLTPDRATGLGAWSDGEILRAVREGVDRDGAALFPMMPYGRFRHLSDEDAAAVVAYLRTLEPIVRPEPPRVLDFPLPLVVALEPAPVDGPVVTPDPHDRVAWGRYLVTLAGCEDCHTPVDERFQPLPGLAFAGGREFVFPWGGSVRSANVTPDAETGIGTWTEQAFVGRIRAYADPAAHDFPVDPARNTVMPWLPYSGMTDEDLGAIYAYLRTVPPVSNRVQRWPDPSSG